MNTNYTHPVLRLMGVDSIPADHTLVIIIVRVTVAFDGFASIPVNLARIPANLAVLDHTTNEVVVRDDIHANRALPHHNTRETIVLDHTLDEIVSLGAPTHHGLGEIITLTTIFTVNPRFMGPRILPTVPVVHTCAWRCVFDDCIFGAAGGILLVVILYWLDMTPEDIYRKVVDGVRVFVDL